MRCLMSNNHQRELVPDSVTTVALIAHPIQLCAQCPWMQAVQPQSVCFGKPSVNRFKENVNDNTISSRSNLRCSGILDGGFCGGTIFLAVCLSSTRPVYCVVYCASLMLRAPESCHEDTRLSLMFTQVGFTRALDTDGGAVVVSGAVLQPQRELASQCTSATHRASELPLHAWRTAESFIREGCEASPGRR